MNKTPNVNDRRWAVMRKDAITRPDGVRHLVRWRLVQMPGFGIFLNRFDGPDPDPRHHDHPWPFLSFVLWGGYEESIEVREGLGYCWDRSAGHVIFHRSTDRHRIVRLLGRPTWTLVLVGRRCREWGFWDDDVWAPWYECLDDAHTTAGARWWRESCR